MFTYCSWSLISVVVLHTKLFTRFSNDGSYLGIMRLYDPREEMVHCLVVENTSEHSPEPAVCCKIFSGSTLKLRPTKQCMYPTPWNSIANSPITLEHIVLVDFLDRPVHLAGHVWWLRDEPKPDAERQLSDEIVNDLWSNSNDWQTCTHRERTSIHTHSWLPQPKHTHSDTRRLSNFTTHKCSTNTEFLTLFTQTQETASVATTTQTQSFIHNKLFTTVQLSQQSSHKAQSTFTPTVLVGSNVL